MRTLLSSLTDHPMAMLRGIADLRGVELSSNARDDTAVQLTAALTTADATATALSATSAAAQTAWAALQAAGGRMKTPVFTRSHGAIQPIGPGRLEREAAWQQPHSPAEELWYRGLIYRGFADFGDGPAEYIYIPTDLALDNNVPRAAPPIVALVEIPEPAHKRQAFNLLTLDSCALLAAARETPLRIDAAGRLPAAESARLHEWLLLSEPARVDLAVALAQQRKWLALDRGRLALNSQAATGWLRATPWEQMTALFEAWRESTDVGAHPGLGWNDLRRLPALQAEGAWRNDPLLARRAILAALARLTPGAWYNISDLVDWIKATNPDFQRPDGNYIGWYLRDVETGRYLSGFESWDDVEGRLIRFMITGPLFWLGVLTLGAATADRTDALRVTQIGAAWLAGTLPRELPRPAPLTVNESFVITAPLLLPLLDRFRLLRFTEPAAETYEPGQPTRHRITRGGLARARAAGVRAQVIVEFLQRVSGGRVPARVIAALARWDEHGGAVRVTRGAVLRVEDANILAALRSDPALAPLLGDLISAQAVMVNEANLSKVLAALAELGYTTQSD